MELYRVAVLLTWSLALVLPSQAHAYSVNTTDDGLPIRWGVDSVGVRIDPELEAWLAPGVAFSALSMAFDAWRGLPRVPDLIIKHGLPGAPGYHGRASNGVYLVERWDHAPQKLAVTVVTFELETGRLLDADVLVNPDVAFDLLDDDGAGRIAKYDLAAVLTHEAGHVLGLGESEDDPDATMWPYAHPGDMHQRTLSDDDEEGAIEAYAGPPPGPAAGCGAMRVSHGARHGEGVALTLASLAGLWLVLRRRRGGLVPGLCLGLTGVLLVPTGEPPRPAPHEIVSDAHAAASLRQARPDDELRALRRFAGEARRIELGAVEAAETSLADGLLRTRYRVRGEDGHVREMSVPGGALDGIGQRVVGEPMPPQAGASVALAAQPDGRLRWAYHHDGRLHGGDLGERVELPLRPLD